jgi:hypothetical protein
MLGDRNSRVGWLVGWRVRTAAADEIGSGECRPVISGWLAQRDPHCLGATWTLIFAHGIDAAPQQLSHRDYSVTLLLAGGGLLAFGVSMVQEMRELLAGAHSAEAIVLQMEAVSSTNGPRTNRVVVRYTDSDGISHEARTAISASSYEFSIGERVSVLYNHAVTEEDRESQTPRQGNPFYGSGA